MRRWIRKKPEGCTIPNIHEDLLVRRKLPRDLIDLITKHVLYEDLVDDLLDQLIEYEVRNTILVPLCEYGPKDDQLWPIWSDKESGVLSHQAIYWPFIHRGYGTDVYSSLGNFALEINDELQAINLDVKIEKKHKDIYKKDRLKTKLGLIWSDIIGTACCFVDSFARNRISSGDEKLVEDFYEFFDEVAQLLGRPSAGYIIFYH